jgi:hypothetical protein
VREGEFPCLSASCQSFWKFSRSAIAALVGWVEERNPTSFLSLIV